MSTQNNFLQGRLTVFVVAIFGVLSVLACLLVPIVFAYLSFTRHANQTGRKTLSPKIAHHTSDIPSLWELQNIYAGSSRQSLLVVQDSKVLLLGSDEPGSDWKVIAFDGSTGQKVWTYYERGERTLVTDQSKLFVGGIGQVTALNLEDGTVLWSTQLPLLPSVQRLFVREEMVYADILNSQYILLKIQDGTILDIRQYDDSSLPFWEREFDAPGFIGKIMYVYRENANELLENGVIAAVDTTNGSELWRSNVFIISNFAVTKNYVYALSIKGELLRFDPHTGSTSTLIHILPVPVKSNYVDEERTYQYFNYVAVDSDDQFVYLYLGDSQQLLAYKIGQ